MEDAFLVILELFANGKFRKHGIKLQPEPRFLPGTIAFCNPKSQAPTPVVNRHTVYKTDNKTKEKPPEEMLYTNERPGTKLWT